MPKVGLIADVHGNEMALSVVLSHLEHARVDQIVCLGDMATLGPRPREVLEILRALDCICISGNHDRFLLQPSLVEAYTDAQVIVDSISWCRHQLGNDDITFLRALEPSWTLDLGSGISISMVHGTPRSDTEDLLATTPPDEVDAMLAGVDSMIVACGHTHIQMVRQHRGRILVNPGSVGLPFREYVAGGAPDVLPHAEYAIVHAAKDHLGVDLHRIPLDREALSETLRSCDLPLRDVLMQQYVTP